VLGKKKKEVEEEPEKEEPEEEQEETKESRVHEITVSGEVDPRYASMVKEHHEKSKRSIEGYLSGRVKPLAVARGGSYKVLILDDTAVLYIKNSLPQEPAPAGSWMNWWELDHQKYFGVDRFQYNKMTRPDRAELEAKLQLRLWVESEFWVLYAGFYFPEEYGKWWWDEGGSVFTREKGSQAASDYWEKRIKQ
jgi:hypothetical protein